MKFIFGPYSKRFAHSLVLMLGLMQIVAAAGAQTSSQDHIFTVYGVAVDVTARNARDARVEALSNVQVTSFNRLLRKISLEDRLVEAQILSANNIRNYVSGIVVHGERTSSRRYIATMDVSFNKEKVLEYLGTNNLPYTELTGGPLLLLPVYEYGGVSSLFEEDNPWRDALYKADMENHLYKFNLAEGGFEDQLLVGNTDVLRRNVEDFQGRFKDLNNKYNTSDILIARAWWGEVGENGLKNLHFSYGRGLSPSRDSGVIIASAGQTQESMFVTAAQAIFARMDIAWRQQTLTTFGSFNELAVHVVAQSATEWVDIIERLEGTPIVRTVEVEKLAVPVSQINIVYGGVFEQLRLVLEGVNLTLVEQYDGWYLEKTVN